MKKALINIREFFWPMLERNEHFNDSSPDSTIQISNENLEQAFKLKSEIFESEEERRKTVETKASLLINTISIATSIVVAANTLVIGSQENNLAVQISVIISFILCLYTVRTVWFSIKALQRGSYHVIAFNDINIPGNKEEYLKHLIISLKAKSENNESTINTKVDYLTLAQEYYKRAIGTIFLYSFFVLVFALFFKSTNKSLQDHASNKIINTQVYNLTDTLNIDTNQIDKYIKKILSNQKKDSFILKIK